MIRVSIAPGVLRAPILFVIALLLVAPCFAREAPLPPTLLRAMKQARIPEKNLSILVRDANTDTAVIDLNGDWPRSPASTIKVLTTFAALDMLGPSYTWKTRVFRHGTLRQGVLDGDLIIVGGGDPYMTSDRWWSFVQNLRETGLKRITGDLVIDNGFFAPIEGSRSDFDDKPWHSYNVLPDALMVNFQTSRFTLTVEPQRARPQISVTPLPANLQVKNQVLVGKGACSGYNRGVTFNTPADDPLTVVVGGVLPAACGSFSINRAIMTAPHYAYGTFRTLWEQSGGSIEGKLRLGKLPDAAVPLYTHDSLPLPEMIRLVNKFSNNVMARHLLLTLGAEQFGPPANAEQGREAVRLWLAERDIRMPGFVLDNGSGLSRTERVTVRGLADLLDLAWHSPFMPEFAASLPLSATDGTLRNRFRAAGMQGRLRLKTGRLDDVTGLAGFVNAASGKTYIVAVLVNHPGAHNGSADIVQTELIRWIFSQ